MRLILSLVLTLIVGAVQGASETAKAYIIQEPEFPTSHSIPTLSLEEAKLVIAQRLGNSHLYRLRGASTETLAHINTFGGPQKQLFDDESQDVRTQFLIVIDNTTPEATARYQKVWAPIKPAFEISGPTSILANEQLISDLIEERPGKVINPECRNAHKTTSSNKRCWPDLSRVMQFHTESAESREKSNTTVQQVAEILANKVNEGVDVMIILLPESRYDYDLFDMPAQPLSARSAQLEEPMEESETSSVHQSNVFHQAKGKKNTSVIYSTCYQSNETCQNATNNCSGHGKCYMSYSNPETSGDSCFTCGCIPSINITLTDDGVTQLTRRTYWGGAACQKEDISSPFWLIVGVTVALMGLGGAAVGMLFSIGEEKLPSVIGAGVSASKPK